MTIQPAETPGDIEAVRCLFREYEAFLGVDLCFQGFEAELAALPGKYAPPRGALLIARIQDRIAGCVALRPLADGVCEMKRLFVRPEFRGIGVGRDLATAIIRIAREQDYTVMRLDTLDRLTEAMRLYDVLGFRKIGPYYRNPLPGVVYWELDLKNKNGFPPATAGRQEIPS